MKLLDLIKGYGGNACISISGYCNEAYYDYYLAPLDEWGRPDNDPFSGNNPNHYICTCLEKESWWPDIANREVERWGILGGGMYKVELFIKLHEKGDIYMKFLNHRYAKVYSHKGFDICTLQSACPEKGDSLGYVIDDAQFAGQDFELLEHAIRAIDLTF